MIRLVGDSGAPYLVEPEPVAVGGEALIHRARALDDDAPVAIRVELVPGALAAQTERLEQLARHPICGPVFVGIWDRGTWEGRHFQVMDWIPHTLADVARDPRPEVRRRAVRSLVAAVQRTHRCGEVHGDIKPANVLVRDGDPEALLLADPRPVDAPGHTPGFAAPEQIRNGAGSLQADRYAVAATAWLVLSGGVRAEPELFDRLVDDPRLRAVLEAMLDFRADRRPDLDALAASLDRAPESRSWALSRALALALVALGAVLTSWAATRTTCPPGFDASGPTCEGTDGLSVVRVPAGRFTMGREPQDDPERIPDARPHEVALTRAFWLGTTEVTQGQWARLGGGRPVEERDQLLDGGVDHPCGAWKGHTLVGDDLPVVCVSFRDVARWLNDLSRRHGLRPAYRVGAAVEWDRTAGGWRLPTEAEWEWAASRPGASVGVCERANLRDQSAPEHWGNESPCDDGDPVLARVGRRPANALGLLDLEGNALEWVWDRYGLYPAGPVVDPAGPDHGRARVSRGASWNHVPRGIRARYASDPETWDYSRGFRIARSVPR